jgi:DNA-binding transcriptional LysR family regulator
MFIRQMYYLVAIEKTKHFRRAAELANVSQPALSSAIQHLEEELGVKIIQRGKRFQGFTPEGSHLLEWAHKVIYEWEGMCQAAAQYGTQLTGTLKIGAIPTSIAIMPLITDPYRTQYPNVKIGLSSLSAAELIQKLDEFELDLGVSYADETLLKGFKTHHLYQERYVLLSRNPAHPDPNQSLTWSDAAKLPLCLLAPDMQNRRIIDAAFREANVIPNVVLETNSIFAVYTHVRCAGLYSIVPHSLLSLFEMRQEVTAIPLAPEFTRSIVLVGRSNHHLSPIEESAWKTASQIDLQSRLDMQL